MARKSNEQSLKDVLHDFFHQSKKLRDGYIRHKIFSAWKEIVGVQISSKTVDIWYSDKKLYVSIESSVFKHELHFRKEDMIKAINEYLQEDYVEEIMIK